MKPEHKHILHAATQAWRFSPYDHGIVPFVVPPSRSLPTMLENQTPETGPVGSIIKKEGMFRGVHGEDLTSFLIIYGDLTFHHVPATGANIDFSKGGHL